MQFSRTFIVEDSEPMVHHQLGLALREAGYILLPDGRYQRGTREGSMLSFDPTSWFTRIQADTRSTPEFYTKVVLSYDVQTAGQALKHHIRQFWIDEVNRFAASLGARYDSAQDKLTQSLGLDLIPPVEPADSAEEAFADPKRSMVLTPVQASLRYQRERQQKNGANWFFWIAGLSVLNSIIYLLDAQLSFIVGLAATQIVDGIATAVIEQIPEGLAFLRVMALLIDLAVVGLFAGFGLLARRGKAWAFIIGMGLYFLDGLIFLLVGDWFAVLFHGIALYGLLRGYLACRELRKLDEAHQVISPA